MELLLLNKLLSFCFGLEAKGGWREGWKRFYLTSVADFGVDSFSGANAQILFTVSPLKCLCEFITLPRGSLAQVFNSPVDHFLPQLLSGGESRPVLFSWAHVVIAGYLLGAGGLDKMAATWLFSEA